MGCALPWTDGSSSARNARPPPSGASRGFFGALLRSTAVGGLRQEPRGESHDLRFNGPDLIRFHHSHGTSVAYLKIEMADRVQPEDHNHAGAVISVISSSDHPIELG